MPILKILDAFMKMTRLCSFIRLPTQSMVLETLFYKFLQKRMECLQGLKPEQRLSRQKTEAMCLKDMSQIVPYSSLNLKASVHSFCGQLSHSITAPVLN